MSSIQIFTWVITPITLGAFIFTYSLLMIQTFKNEKYLVNIGNRDKEIAKAYMLIDGEPARRYAKKAVQIVSKIVGIFLTTLLLILLVIGLLGIIKNNEYKFFKNRITVCASDSMSVVHPNNKYYIEKNNLDNRFSKFDLLLLKQLPNEADIKLFDIVTYIDKNDRTIIHRIVGIEKSDNGLLYTMRGDANGVSDSEKISYSNMVNYYDGSKIESIGIIVFFAQSSFGVIALLLSIYIFTLETILSNKLEKMYENKFVDMTLEIELDINSKSVDE